MRIRIGLALFVCLACFYAWTASLRVQQASAGERQASLLQVRYWSSARYTRVVFDLDREVDYSVGRLGKDVAANRPERIYVDLRDTAGSQGVAPKMELPEGPVQGVRCGRYDPRTTRLVLDLRQAEDYNVFRLEEPFRIVLDLWWKKDGRGQEKPADGQGAGVSSKAGTIRLPLVVLDPGHGGHDPGAVGRGGLKEKDLVLAVAKYVREILQGQNRARVVLTRDTDRFLPLETRAWIANSKDADLFVSIHANAHPRREVSGVETYYLDNTTDKAAMRVAAMENNTPEKKIDDLSRILIDLRCNANAWESHELAHTMQKALVGEIRRNGYNAARDLGAKGGLFYVLLGAHMPSIVVEVAFLSNPTEEKMLKTPAYQKVLAEGIAEGIMRYLGKRSRSELVARQGEL